MKVAPVTYTYTYKYVYIHVSQGCAFLGSNMAPPVKPCAYTVFSCGLYLEKLQGSCALPQGESEAQTLTLSQRLRPQGPSLCPSK